MVQTGIDLASVKMSMNPFCEIALEVRSFHIFNIVDQAGSC